MRCTSGRAINLLEIIIVIQIEKEVSRKARAGWSLPGASLQRTCSVAPKLHKGIICTGYRPGPRAEQRGPLPGCRGHGQGYGSDVSRLSQQSSFTWNSLLNYRLFRNKSSFSTELSYWIGSPFGLKLGDSATHRIAIKPHTLRLLLLREQVRAHGTAAATICFALLSFSVRAWPVFYWTCPTMTSYSTWPRLILSSSTFPLLFYDNILL